MSVAISRRSVCIKSLVRPNILELTGYTSSSDSKPELLTGERLHANESPFSWESMDKYAISLNRYPSPPYRLNNLLADLWGTSRDQLCLSRGSGEGIDLLIRLFCNPGKDAVLSFTPGFDLYRFYSQINNVRYDTLQRNSSNNFRIDFRQIIEGCNPNTRLIFLCNPDNPTGQFTDPGEIAVLLQKLPEGVILVVDEAYIDFSDTNGMSCAVKDFQNLIVLRTLSKAWGLAGARCGGIIAHREIIDLCKRISAPYPHSSPVLKIVEDLISKSGRQYFDNTVIQTVKLRESLKNSLRKSPHISQVMESRANFLFVKPRNYSSFVESLESKGILVRIWTNCPGGWLRISVGDSRQVSLLQQVL